MTMDASRPDSRPAVLAEKCSTCIFRPGNLMHLRPGRVRDMVNESIRRGGAITCHKTLSYGEHPGYGEAMCRGFYDTVGERTNIIRVIHRLGGFREVPEPGAPPKPEEG